MSGYDPERRSGGSLAASEPQRLLEGIDNVSSLLVGRREHSLIAHAAPSIEVRALGDVVILDLHNPGFGPFAVLTKLDIGGHDRGESVAAKVFGELVVVETFGALDRLLQHLEIGVAPSTEVIAYLSSSSI